MRSYKFLSFFSLVPMMSSTLYNSLTKSTYPTTISSRVLTSRDCKYNYSIYNNEITINKYIGRDTDVTIPTNIDDLPVVAIWNQAFKKNTELISLTIPEDIYIGDNAFEGCTSLERAIMPNLTTIGQDQFYGCTALKTVDIPKVTTIKSNAFFYCTSLENISMPEVTTLLFGVFQNCIKLNEVFLPKLQTLGDYTFECCSSLATISLPEITALPQGSFYSATALEFLDIPKVETIAKYAFKYCTSLKNISLPKVIEISEYTFVGSSVSTVDLPLVTTIGDSAFMNTPLSTIELPQITTLSDKVFYNCTSLRHITISKNIETIGTDVFTLSPITSITIDYGTEDISYVIMDDWEEFINKIPDLYTTKVKGRYIKNTSRTRSLPDTTPPVIKINGDKFMSVQINTDYKEQGATATDDSGAPMSITTSGSVNTSVLGNYKIIYTTEDASGNAAKYTRIVTVVDTISPIIVLTGTNPMTLEVGLSTYTEPGYFIYDNSKEVITPLIHGYVDTNKVGEYSITYTATDSSNNSSSKTRIVNVVDTIAPIINLKGNNLLTLEVGDSSYTDPGVTISDNSGEDITADINGYVNINKIGHYEITYTATDSSNNSSSVTRIVDVIDTTAPVIKLNGDNPLILEVGSSTSIEPVVTVSDNSGEDITPDINGFVDTSKIGHYEATYTATDSSNNSSSITRIVDVIDTTAPVIKLNGDNPMVLEVGVSSYTEPGATVSDNSGEDITADINGSVDTSKIGEYKITYTATDSSNNSSSVTRIINVVDTTAPIITLNGDNAITLTLGSTYIEPGAIVMDNSLEQINAVIVSDVDTSKVGMYTVTYSATDSSNNQADVVTRTVKVIYNYMGLNIKNDNISNIFKYGHTIPIHFQLQDVEGNFVSTANVKLYYAKVIDNTFGTVKNALTWLPFITGNSFKYNSDIKEYVFSMNTLFMRRGSYKLIVSLDDGETYDDVEIIIQ